MVSHFGQSVMISSNNHLRLDPLTGRWIIVSKERANRPTNFAPSEKAAIAVTGTSCPFCKGASEEAGKGYPSDDSSWQVKVIPNKYPCFSGQDPFVVTHVEPVFIEAPASGIHEVIVLSPNHDKDWASLNNEEVFILMSAIQDRMQEHITQKGLRYSQVIVNQGKNAGASIEHPHAQLISIPFLPRELTDEQGGFARFAGGCLLCTTIDIERRVNYRITLEDDQAVAMCPFWSGVPFESLIIPKQHTQHLWDSTENILFSVGVLIRDTLKVVKAINGNLSYNIVFHSGPHRISGTFHWHVHIYPQLTTQAGLEKGSGLLVNVVPPEQAAQEIKQYYSVKVS